MADEKELGNVVSSLDMAEFLSEPQNTDKTEDIFQQDTRQEPELVVEGENLREDLKRVDGQEIRGEIRPESLQPDERLDSALRTIDLLRGELETRSQPRQQISSTQNIEWMETPWGIQIPKDPQNRFVKLTAEHLEQVGIDGSIAPGLNVLANAFWASIVNTIPQNTMRAMDEIQNRRSTDRERLTSFFDEYSDLKDHAEFVQLIEHSARQRESHVLRGLSTDDYRKEISRRVRSKIAAMRGISLDQYEREVGVNSRPVNPRRLTSSTSRARSVGGGASSARSAPRNNDIFTDTLYGG